MDGGEAMEEGKEAEGEGNHKEQPKYITEKQIFDKPQNKAI